MECCKDKEARQKSKTASGTGGNNILKIVVMCLLGVLLFITVLNIFRVPILSTLPFLILLACPLLHLIMMRSGKHKH